ncbi:hypothetical protein TFLX_06159 [Thermoflexales bacterium]|nr:hypothetical protein TFLX_06159 [Thermoflexales bacterium]
MSSRSPVLSLIGVLLCSLLLVLLVLALPARSQTQSLAPTANGWTFTPIVTVGQNGFTSLNQARINESGLVAVTGCRPGSCGLFTIHSGTVVTVATTGMVLPGGGTISSIYDFDIDPTGRVIFRTITGQSFRWNNGTLSTTLPNVPWHLPKTINSRGQWLHWSFNGPDGNRTETFKITDGVIVTKVMTLAETAADCRVELVGDDFTAPNAQGALLYEKTVQVNAKTGSGDCDSFQFTRDWTLGLAGTISHTVAGGQLTEPGFLANDTNGSLLESYRLNDNGDTVYIKSVFINAFNHETPTSRQLVVVDGSGETLLVDNLALNVVEGFDNSKRVTFALINGDIYAGPNLLTDRVISPGDTLFGQTVAELLLSDVSAPPATTGDQRVILFRYTLADGTLGFAVASKSVTRWVNPAGGDWTTAANWLPAEVPGPATGTLFDLEANYAITVGTRTSGRSSVENGDVRFRNTALTLIGPLSIGRGAKLTLPEGTLNVGEITIGHLPPISPLTPTLAQLYVSNVGTIITGNPSIIIGHADEGEMFVSDALVNSSQVRIGANSPGAAIVGGNNGEWYMNSLAVGSGYTGTLDVEHGGDVYVNGPAIVGHGAVRQEYLATLNVDGAGSSGLTLLVVSETLTVGHNLRGRLDISGGGSVYALQDVDLGAIEHLNAQTQPDGELIVRGESDDAQSSSSLIIARDLRLGLDLFNARSHLWVEDGATVRVAGTMTMSVEPGSRSQLVVRGAGTEQRTTMTVGTPDQTESCLVGDKSEARVFVYGGGRLRCIFLYVGGQNLLGNGIVVVDRRGSALPTVLSVDALLAIGNHPDNNGGWGRLVLREGDVLVGLLMLFPGSRIEGSGRIGLLLPDSVMALEGAVDPGVTLGPFDLPLEPIESVLGRTASSDPGVSAPPSLPIIQPGVLVISNSVTLSPTAVITLDVIGKTPSLYDRLIVSGTATLGGQLVLNFSNGFAPKQGDSFQFLQAGAFASTFQTTTLAGLAPGFTYTLSSTGGVLNLVALNDGVPTTQAQRRVYLPLIRR